MACRCSTFISAIIFGLLEPSENIFDQVRKFFEAKVVENSLIFALFRDFFHSIISIIKSLNQVILDDSDRSGIGSGLHVMYSVIKGGPL